MQGVPPSGELAKPGSQLRGLWLHTPTAARDF